MRLAILAAVLAMGAVTCAGTSAVSAPATRQAPARALVGEMAFPTADVLALQMFNPHDGVGIAGLPPSRCERPCLAEAPTRAYLVVTVDGGLRWRTTGTVPEYFGPFIPSADMAFQSQAAGYLQTSRVTIYTDDGGRAWVAGRGARCSNCAVPCGE